MIRTRIGQMCFAALVGLVSLSFVACDDTRPPTGPTVTRVPATPAAPQAPAGPPSVLSGVVFEPGVGPLAGVSVVVTNVAIFGATAVTDGEGRFSIAGYQNSVVSFTSAGFFTRYLPAPSLPGWPSGIALPLQRAQRIEIPGSLIAQLFPDDPTYLTDDEEVFWFNTGMPDYDCSPCKTFDLRPFMTGRSVQVRVRWTAPVALTVSLGGHYDGIKAQRTAVVGEREVTVQTSSSADTLLIGMASPSGIRQPIPGPIDLHIDVTLP